MNVRGAAAAVAVAAGAVLVSAEFATVFEVTVGALETVKRSATGGANHGYALLVLGLVAAAIALVAARGGRAPAIALVALGLAALAVALAVDLPDTRGSGRLPESLAYEDAHARAGFGLYLEIAGAVLVAGAGLVLLALGRGSEK